MSAPLTRLLAALLLVVATLVGGPALAEPIAVDDVKRDEPVMFERDILPILRRNCLACHSRSERQGDLVMETRAEILAGGDTGPAIVPEKGEESLLLTLAAHRREPVMPPAENDVAAVALTPAELGLLRLWIDQGARVAGAGGAPVPTRWQPMPAGFNPALAVALAPDGQTVASAVANRLRLHHVATGGLVTEFVDQVVDAWPGAGGGPGVAHRDVIGALAFDPSGDTLASGGFREVKLWRRPRDVKAWQGSAGGPTPVMAVTPDGRLVATAAGAVVKTWDAATGAAGREFAGHAERITALAFPGDGTTLVSASADGMIRLAAATDGTLRGVVETPLPVTAFDIVPHAGRPGGRLVVAGADNQVRTFELPERAPQKMIATVVADRRAVTTHDRHWMAVAEPAEGGRTRLEVLKVDAAGRTEPQSSFTLPPLAAPMTGLVLLPGAAKEAIPRIVVGSGDGLLTLVAAPADGAGGEGRVERRWRAAAAKVTALAAASDGKTLATGLENGQTTLWRLGEDAPRAAPVATDMAAVTAFAHHPARRLVALAGSLDGKPVIRVIRLEGGLIAATLPGHEGGTTALAFSADGGRVVSGGADGIVRLSDWTNAAALPIGRFEAGAAVTAVAVSPDVTLVMAARDDTVLRTWTVADGLAGKDLSGHAGKVLAVGFLAGNQPWSVGAERSVKVWNVAEARPASAWDLPAPPTALGLSADGNTLVAAGEDKLIRTHALANGQIQQTFTGHAAPVVAVGLASDGKRLVSLERDGGREGTFLWDVPTGRLAEAVDQAVVAESPQLGLLLDGAESSSLAIRGDGRLLPADLRFARHLEGGQQGVSGLAFLGGGQQVIAAGVDGSIRGYQVESGQGVFTAGHGVAIRTLAVADEQTFATGGAEGSLRLWQAGGAAFGIHGIGNLGGEVTAIAWSDDRTRIVTAIAGGKPTVTIHDTTTGVLLQRFTSHAQPVTHLACVVAGGGGNAGPEGAQWVLSTAADGAWRWQVVAGRSMAGLNQNPVHGGAVTAVARFPGDGGEVLTGCADGVARRIRLADGQVVTQYAHGGPVAGVAVSADGARVATVGENKLARLWQAGGQQVTELRGDQRLRTAMAGLTRQVTTATERVARTKQLLEAADKDLPVRNDAFTKATAALAAAMTDVQQKTTAAMQASDAKTAAERESIAASAAARAMQLAKKKADQAVKEVGVELQVAQQRVVQRQAASDVRPADAGLKQAVAEATAVVPQVQQKQQGAQAMAQAAAQAATNAATAAGAAATKATEAGKPAAAAVAALKTAEGAKRLAMQQGAIAKRELEQAQVSLQVARDSHQRAEGTLNETKGRLDATTGAANAAEQPIRRVAFSPDSTRLATVGDFPSAQLWDAASGAALSSYAGGGAGLVSVAFLSGSRFVTLAADGAIVTWETNPPWTLAATIGGDHQPGLIADRVTSVDFSADGTQLLVAGGVPSRSGELAIFQVADGARSFHLPQAHDDVVHAARFSPDGRRIASGGADKYLRTFDIASMKPLRRFEGHTNYLLGVAWKGDGLEIASAGADAAVKVWDADSGDQKQSIGGFTRHVTAVEYRGATDEIVSTSGDKQVRVHNASNGGLARTIPSVPAWLHGLDVTASGEIVAAGSADGTVHVWNAINGQVLATISAENADAKAADGTEPTTR
ncbi:MAG: hypothetical protein DWH87_06490 [Planctomycetota bacterium]|nr:MAG: hypothetical protein DWH87_06490 [Planctomycetota bacterium]